MFLADQSSPNGSTRSSIPTTELQACGGAVFNGLTTQAQQAREAVASTVGATAGALSDAKSKAQFAKAALKNAQTAKPKVADGSDLSPAQQSVRTVIDTATAALTLATQTTWLVFLVWLDLGFRYYMLS